MSMGVGSGRGSTRGVCTVHGCPIELPAPGVPKCNLCITGTVVPEAPEAGVPEALFPVPGAMNTVGGRYALVGRWVRRTVKRVRK